MRPKPEARAANAQADIDTIRTRAVKLLARREHSGAELRHKLLQRGFDADRIEQALARLRETNLLDEGRYAEQLIEARARKGYGPRRILAELRNKGVDDADVEAALERVDIDWIAAGMQVRQKHYGSQAPDSFEERAKQSAYLQRRGFTGDQIRQILAGA